MIKPWTDLNDSEKKVYCRLQEAFAGMLDHADHHIGRLVAALDEMGIRDDTLIMVVSDNGSSQEGLMHGVTNTDRYRNFNPETVEEMLKNLDKIGGPETDSLYPMGWSLAGNTPFKKWKQDTHSGGNTDPFIDSWPAEIKEGGKIRPQYHHLVDVDADHPRSGRTSCPHLRQRNRPDAAARREHGVHLQRRRGENPQTGAVLRDAR